ncbi:MAG: NAD(P)H-dependent glycerol-3-phosphate dehydrogenase [Peptococcaceae bacterium]|nr:NAD(P)H-dependent glycerol-3-phosphate dehydrogenase [Peptococcaceae bacterium]
MSKVTVLGCGSWGTALAIVLASKGQPVQMWCRRAEQADEMNSTRENKKYLPDVVLPEGIGVTTDLAFALEDTDYVVLAVPSQTLRENLNKIKDLLPEKAVLINTAKGLEVGTNLRMSQVVEDVIPGSLNRFVALYGPSHAEEVGRAMPTAVVSCSVNAATAESVQDLFMAPAFRVYTNNDLIGTEIGGAIKNIIAIATGIAIGLGLGDNTQAALLTRGMAEISRLGTKLGADPMTFSGLTGIGDLVVTCTSRHSRNHRCGLALGQGKKLDEILNDMGMVVEGVKTTKATVDLARELGISMPIAEMMYKVLFEDFPVQQAVGELMGRNKKSEREKEMLGV